MRRLILALLTALVAQPVAATEFNPQIEGMVSGYIRPVTARFAETAGALPVAVAALCETPNDRSAERFAAAFADTVEAFSEVHFLRFGPLLDEDRLSRLAFLPDPRGITQRQLRKVLAARNKEVHSAADLADKSVAVQGLTALELIAFSKTGEVMLGDDPFKCGYALAIAENVAAIAGAVADGWADPDGYSAVLLMPGPDNDRFHTSKEALENLFNSLVTGLIIARDQDVLPALGGSKEKAKAHRFPFSRSANSVTFISGELEGIRQALASLGLEALTPEDFTWIFGGLAFEFKNAQSLLDELEPPLRQTLEQDSAYEKVEVLAITLKSIRDTMALELAGALDLAGGFNALDGD
ncbi:imelysin family protein [Roseibium sp. Sym1]|uniref:imelysin family protein n=1 Tax=Roseibium sp. Sym1 TaxID=3016006 RepID=UPI0022B5426D|nr:imelysin family protein [Roseibium sp. Sym1]